jgi:hypothetical protein
MELLVVKTGDDYIRIKDDAYIVCDLNKASVFTLDNVSEIKMHIARLETLDFKSVRVKKLVLREEDFDL